jgi:hypothetical protein
VRYESLCFSVVGRPVRYLVIQGVFVVQGEPILWVWPSLHGVQTPVACHHDYIRWSYESRAAVKRSQHPIYNCLSPSTKKSNFVYLYSYTVHSPPPLLVRHSEDFSLCAILFHAAFIFHLSLIP